MVRVATVARLLVACAAIATFVAGCGEDAGSDRDGGSDDGDLVAQGRDAYEANCAACHGDDLRGTSSGPPFLDPIYAPDHHPDEVFFSAVENGVQPHHWDFGPMPPQPAVTEEQVEAIVAYVRARQEDAGITSDASSP